MFWLSYECLSILCDTFFASKKGHFQQLWLYIAVSIDDLSYTGYGIRQYNDIAHGDYFRLQKKKKLKRKLLIIKKRGRVYCCKSSSAHQTSKKSIYMVDENGVIYMEQYNTHYIFTENEQKFNKNRLIANRFIIFNEFVSEYLPVFNH